MSVLDSKKAEEIIAFLESYNKHFDELKLFFAQKKLHVVSDDLLWLLDSLTEEQRLIMRGNSIEAKRLLLFKDAGVADMGGTDITAMMPEELKGKSNLELTKMRESIDEIKLLNATILDMVDKKLSVQADLAHVENNDNEIYTEDGKLAKKHNDGGFFAQV